MKDNKTDKDQSSPKVTSFSAIKLQKLEEKMTKFVKEIQGLLQDNDQQSKNLTKKTSANKVRVTAGNKNSKIIKKSKNSRSKTKSCANNKLQLVNKEKDQKNNETDQKK